MTKKLTYEFVKTQFEKENYKLLSKEYKNAHQKLSYICPVGHRHKISWNKWSQGKRCYYCFGAVKLNINFVREEFKKDGYELLTGEYINSKQKLRYICPNNHEHSVIWESWKAGTRCSICSGKAKPTLEFVISEFEKEGYTLLSNKYERGDNKLKYKCSNNHEHEITWNNWYNHNQRCGICFDTIYRFGETASNWKGGISCEPYCDVWLDKEFKDSIKKRDNYECQNKYCCGKSKRLVVHHIDYNKKNCSTDNLITLCNSCNSRANANRGWHKEYYGKIIIDRGD